MEEEVWTYMKRSVAPKEDWPSAETIRIDRVLELREHRHSVRHTHAQNATLERTASHQLTAACDNAQLDGTKALAHARTHTCTQEQPIEPRRTNLAAWLKALVICTLVKRSSAHGMLCRTSQ